MIRHCLTGLVGLTVVLLAAAAAEARGQAPDDRPHFDAASLKLSSQGTVRDATRDPGRISYRSDPLGSLIVWVYGLKSYQVERVPDWGSSQYDLDATFPPGTTTAQLKLMIQVLLEERLKLRVHREVRVRPAYVVTVAKGGPFFAKAESDPSKPAPAQQMSGSNASKGERGAKGTMSVEAFLMHVGGYLDRPIIDKTGLEGLYNIDFFWKTDLAASAAATPVGDENFAPAGGVGGEDNSYLFSEMEKKLGLKIEARKEPVEMLIIDHVERVPVGN